MQQRYNEQDAERKPAFPQLTQPHFDDESTVISAKRVVPLALIQTPKPRRHWLFFTGAMVLSVMAGAFGATLIHSNRNPAVGQSPPAQQVQHDVTAGGSLASTETVPHPDIDVLNPDLATKETSDQPALEVAEPDLEQPSTKPIAKTERAKKAVAAHREVKNSVGEDRDVATNVLDETETTNTATDETREERRPRRVNDETNEVGNDSEDLFRIREIFEGRPRRRLRNRPTYPY